MADIAWEKPWNKPWNDQKWKRDVLHLDAEILREKKKLGELRQQSRKGDPEIKEKIKLSSFLLSHLESKRDRMVITL